MEQHAYSALPAHPATIHFNSYAYMMLLIFLLLLLLHLSRPLDMDPLSITASIAAILKLSDDVLKFLIDIKDSQRALTKSR